MGGGGCSGAGPSFSPSQALLGCTQSQPNKKPFIGRVQLSQTGWEHVAFKNEEAGKGEGEGKGQKAEGGGAENKNEVYDSVRKTDNKTLSWGSSAEAEMLTDRELHKANCVPPPRTLEILLSQICQGWFHPGSGGADGLSPRYWADTWEVKGWCRELRAAAVVCQSFSNLACSPDNASPLLASVNPSNATALRKQRWNRLPALLHAVSVSVFPLWHETGGRSAAAVKDPAERHAAGTPVLATASSSHFSIQNRLVEMNWQLFFLHYYVAHHHRPSAQPAIFKRRRLWRRDNWDNYEYTIELHAQWFAVILQHQTMVNSHPSS